MPNDDVEAHVLAQAASAAAMQEPQEHDERGMFARASIVQRTGKTQREIQKQEKELTHWKEELAANERKRDTCMALLVIALGDDFLDILATIGGIIILPMPIIQAFTFPIPGIIRMLVAAQEREPNAGAMLRTVLAMGIEAIPVLNALPTTTLNLLADFFDALYAIDRAKDKIEALKKKINTLSGTVKQGKQALRRISSAA